MDDFQKKFFGVCVLAFLVILVVLGFGQLENQLTMLKSIEKTFENVSRLDSLAAEVGNLRNRLDSQDAAMTTNILEGQTAWREFQRLLGNKKIQRMLKQAHLDEERGK